MTIPFCLSTRYFSAVSSALLTLSLLKPPQIAENDCEIISILHSGEDLSPSVLPDGKYPLIYLSSDQAYLSIASLYSLALFRHRASKSVSFTFLQSDANFSRTIIIKNVPQTVSPPYCYILHLS